jgi:hypothetical protein
MRPRAGFSKAVWAVYIYLRFSCGFRYAIRIVTPSFRKADCSSLAALEKPFAALEQF